MNHRNPMPCLNRQTMCYCAIITTIMIYSNGNYSDSLVTHFRRLILWHKKDRWFSALLCQAFCLMEWLIYVKKVQALIWMLCAKRNEASSCRLQKYASEMPKILFYFKIVMYSKLLCFSNLNSTFVHYLYIYKTIIGPYLVLSFLKLKI